jgi:cytochrome oxidase Cu insertion factor (SCO1/SenC/PrrC family)
MPGMNTGLSANNSTIVSAFHSALLHQGLVVLLIVAALAVAWNVLRASQLRRAGALAGGTEDTDGTDGGNVSTPATSMATPEPTARRWLRISFGLMWIFDGILQGQASMPLGLVPQGIQPTAAASPSWVQHVVNWGTTVWSFHPVGAAAASVWIQVGIGLGLLVAPRGDWSRLAGVASLAWGLIVWVFGEAFGGIFAPGLSWAFGAPGAVLVYCVAGALVALPEGAWSTARLGRIVLRVMGLFYVGMAVLQAWPGRGFWQGQSSARAGAGSLTSMVSQMAQTSQPHLLATWVSDFGSFDASHGWAVNLFLVGYLAVTGALLLSGRTKLVRAAVLAAIVVNLAVWVLIQDWGFLGGVGTDPNSMVPLTLVLLGGYLGISRLPAQPDPSVVPIRAAAPPKPWRERLSADPAYALRSAAAVGAFGVILLGAVPMAFASANRRADPILSQAVDGSPGAVNSAAPPFSLVDQYGRPVSLSSLQGKTVALTFLDDTCTSDCPVIASEFRLADRYLGSDASKVVMVAINSNPQFLAPDYLTAFDQQEGMEKLNNWVYLTGSLRQLEKVWDAYGEQVVYLPAGAMIGHSEFAWVINRNGRVRYSLDTDPGPATSATTSSFSQVLADTIKTVMHSA